MDRALRHVVESCVEENQIHAVEKKIRGALNKSSGLLGEAGASWEECLEKFVEQFCGTVIHALGREPWFADLDLAVFIQEAAYEILPPHKFRGIPEARLRGKLQDTFEEAYGRIDQECHVDWVIWEMSETISGEDKSLGKKAKSFLSKAWMSSRTQVLDEMVGNPRKEPAEFADDFATKWVSDSFNRLWQATSGALEDALNEDAARAMFQDAFQKGCLPTPITRETGIPPKGWKPVNTAVAEAYAGFQADRDGNWEPPKKRAKKAAQSSPNWEPIGPPKGRQKGRDQGRAPPPARRNDHSKSKGQKGGSNKGGGKGAPMMIKAEADDGAVTGCLECTSGEECIGTPEDDLFRHIDKSAAADEGDFYCSACWGTFLAENPDLEGEHIPRSSL